MSYTPSSPTQKKINKTEKFSYNLLKYKKAKLDIPFRTGSICYKFEDSKWENSTPIDWKKFSSSLFYYLMI